MSIPAFLYARFSSLEQGRGTSLRRQLELAREYADARGWLLDPDREITDAGRSAFSGANRAEGGTLHAFERQVEKGFYRNGAVLVVEHLDRISRQGYEEVLAFLSLMTRNGVTVATMDNDRLYEAGQRIDPGKVMEVIYKAEGALEESSKKSRRVARSWAYKIEAIQAGDRRVRTGLLPGWLVRGDTGEPTLDPHRAAVLREVFDLYVEGHGLPAIVRLLNGRGEPSWAVGGKNKGQGWNTAYLHKLLRNRAVLGEWEPMSRTHGGINETSKGIRIADHYPQAIPAELFNRVQTVKLNRRRVGGPGEATIANLFSGSITCAHCASPMYLQSQQRAGRSTNHRSKTTGRRLSYVAGTDRSYLMCNGNRRHHACDNGARFRYEYLELGVLDAVLALVIDDKQFREADAVASLQAAVAELERVIQGRRYNLTSIVESLGEHFVRALASKAAEIEEQIEGDEARLAVLRGDLARETGSATPAEYLNRVREVRASITSAEERVRYSARARVKQALSHLIRIQCDREGVATVTLASGLMAWRFSTQGELLATMDIRNRLDLHRGLVGGELSGNKGSVDAVLRRSAA